MNKIKKLFEDKIIVLISIFYLLTRLYNLTILPIFTDESIYLYWGKFISTENSHWFIALTDGKSPFLTLIYAFLFKLLPNDLYLVIGRIPSVIFGLMTVIGLYKVANELFHKRSVNIVASIFYVINPFSLLYDRMALYDSQLTAMLIWSLYFCIKTSKSLNLKDAALWGFFLGLGFLAKPPAVLFLAITPLVFLILHIQKSQKYQWATLIKILLIVLLISQGMNNVQRISGAYQQAIIKNQQFQQPVEELLRSPFKLTASNIVLFYTWLETYYSRVFLIFGIFSFLFVSIFKRREGVILFILWFVPIFILATAGREVFPRYLVFLTPYIIIPISYMVWKTGDLFFRKYIFIFIIISSLILLHQQVMFSYFLLTNPSRSPMPAADNGQLVSEHPSGYGLQRIFDYLEQKSKNKKITVVTQGTFGLYPYAFYLEFWENKNIRIIPKWPLNIDEEILAAGREGEVYIIMKEHEEIPPGYPLDLIMASQKPGGKFPILLTILRR